VDIDTFRTGVVTDEVLSAAVRKIFVLHPAGIIKHLELTKPGFTDTAVYGHFGRRGFAWEQTDKTDVLLETVKKGI